MATTTVKTASCKMADLTDHGAVMISLGDQAIGLATPKVFSTGSIGFGFSGPVVVKLKNGGFAECQVSVNVTVKHSKPQG